MGIARAVVAAQPLLSYAPVMRSLLTGHLALLMLSHLTYTLQPYLAAWAASVAPCGGTSL